MNTRALRLINTISTVCLNNSIGTSQFMSNLLTILPRCLLLVAVCENAVEREVKENIFASFGECRELNYGEKYILIVENGKVIYESCGDTVQFSYETGIGNVSVLSDSIASICVSGQEYAQNLLGYNIVIFDSEQGVLIDNVVIDRVNYKHVRENEKVFSVLGAVKNAKASLKLADKIVSRFDEITNVFFQAYSQPNENIEDTKRRYFLNLPKAEGMMRKAQFCLLKLLEIFDSMCFDAKVDYALEGGSTLGAMRHNGFIPWDEDIDIKMLKEDFEKLVHFLSKTDKYTDYHITYGGDKNVVLPQLKVREFTSGFLCVDIFVYTKISKFTDENMVKQLHFEYLDQNHQKLCNLRSELWQDEENFKRCFDYHMQLAKEFTVQLSSEHDEENTKMCRVPGFSWTAHRRIQNAIDIYPTQRVSFESIFVSVANNAIAELTQWYGDWLSFPKKQYFVHFRDDDKYNSYVEEVWRWFMYGDK